VPSLTVTPSEAGQRLDRYLRKVLRGMPASHIYKLLRTRKVRVNGKRARSERILAAGDQIIVHVPEDQFKKDTRRKRRPATRLDFRVVFEDEFLLVVAKPPGLAVHPGAGHSSNSLIDQVHAYLEVDDRPSSFRPSLAHRLDRDTSGLIMVGKSIEVVVELGKMLRDGKIEKSYLALVRGKPSPRRGTWDFEVRRRDVPGTTRPGLTAYQVTSTRKLQLGRGRTLQISLLSLSLLTGRTHQIRSHLQQAGYPLAGDRRYGDPEFNRLLRERYQLRRQFLHAYRLRLRHPVTGKPHKWTDPYPDDLAPLAKSLRLGIPPE
jgi:23S rRNA pseudouridine955/2504/2580 synthase